jgi:xanthine dehydrogenase iron-sulfur cluster and FAD-binding subunit A
MQNRHPAVRHLIISGIIKEPVGAKIGFREGDYKVCTILVGEFKDDNLVYRSITSF